MKKNQSSIRVFKRVQKKFFFVFLSQVEHKIFWMEIFFVFALFELSRKAIWKRYPLSRFQIRKITFEFLKFKFHDDDCLIKFKNHDEELFKKKKINIDFFMIKRRKFFKSIKMRISRWSALMGQSREKFRTLEVRDLKIDVENGSIKAASNSV